MARLITVALEETYSRIPSDSILWWHTLQFVGRKNIRPQSKNKSVFLSKRVKKVDVKATAHSVSMWKEGLALNFTYYRSIAESVGDSYLRFSNPVKQNIPGFIYIIMFKLEFPAKGKDF